MRYGDDQRAIEVGFIPSGLREVIQRESNGAFSEVARVANWSDVDAINRLLFGQAVAAIVNNWPYGLNPAHDRFIDTYGGNLINQADRAVVPIMPDLVLRDDYESLLARFPFIGAFGSPFGRSFMPSEDVPSQEQANELWG